MLSKEIIELIFTASKGIIELIFTGILVLANVILLILTNRNLKLMKENSSPRPFLKPIKLDVDAFRPVVHIMNYGPGHGVNITVRMTVTDRRNGRLGNWVECGGEKVIPYIQGESNLGIYEMDDSNYFYEENTKIEITYENDTGAKGRTMWRYTGLGLDNSFELISGR